MLLRSERTSLLAGFLLASLLFAAHASAQSTPLQQVTALRRPVPLVAGLGDAHHPIHAASPEAQRYFDQGMNYIWAFNHEEARRSFARAAQLSSKDPMPLWGIALAVGPNYNDIDIGHARALAAMASLDRGRALAVNAPAEERDYVAALSARYRLDATGTPVVDGHAYSNAMAALTKKYPDDLEAATLYAESLMDLNPWKLWLPDGKPAPGTDTIIAGLQSVLRRDPDYVGANHLLIHAVEASPNPPIALPSARRIQALAPAAGHLVHMPAHIYQRIGDFHDAATANKMAIAADQAYFKAQHLQGVENMYDSMYYTHNIHFLAASCSMEGNAACTEKAAQQLVDHVLPEVKNEPESEWYTPTLPWMLVRFDAWKKILVTPLPGTQYPVLTAMWHYARGCAYTAKQQLAQAGAERSILAADVEKLPPVVRPDFSNPAKSAFQLALLALDARMQEAQGHREAAITTWKQATALYDTFSYNEPADWYYPVRESLGGALLRNGQPKQAEAVFRRDLQANPGNGRSLFGLWQSLAMQGKSAEAKAAEAKFNAAWAYADTKLSIATL